MFFESWHSKETVDIHENLKQLVILMNDEKIGPIVDEKDYDMPHGQIRWHGFIIRPLMEGLSDKFDVFTSVTYNFPQLRATMNFNEVMEFVKKIR